MLPLCGRTTQFNLIPSVLVRHLTLSTQEIKLNQVVCRVHPMGELKNPCFHQDHKQVNKAYNILNHFIHHKIIKSELLQNGFHISSRRRVILYKSSGSKIVLNIKAEVELYESNTSMITVEGFPH